MKLALMLFLFFVGVLALAAGGTDGHTHIPTKAITIQAINFSILVGLLIYLLRNPIKGLFVSRSEKFHAHIKVAEDAKAKAEEKKKTIKDRLDSLHATSGENLEKAKADAEDLKHQILEDARHLAEKLADEVERTAQYEAEKVIASIRQELIDTSIKSAEGKLVEKVDGAEQKRLQNEFVEKIQVVR